LPYGPAGLPGSAFAHAESEAQRFAGRRPERGRDPRPAALAPDPTRPGTTKRKRAGPPDGASAETPGPGPDLHPKRPAL